MSALPTTSGSRSGLQHRVQCGSADLRELRDLGLRDATGDGLPREVTDHGGLLAGLRLRRCASPAVGDKCFTNLVHESSVKHLTTRGKRRKVLYMSKPARIFSAKFAGKCERCLGPIRKGQAITPCVGIHGTYQHADQAACREGYRAAQTAQMAQAVRDGHLTQEQADHVLARGDEFVRFPDEEAA